MNKKLKAFIADYLMYKAIFPNLRGRLSKVSFQFTRLFFLDSLRSLLRDRGTFRKLSAGELVQTRKAIHGKIVILYTFGCQSQ
jgi:hypothetical protein